ncbi:MAG: nucleotide-binding protein [Myxococcales bacterium]|nr:nucleotide-binding protein [Myxococcales bacterium]
MARMPIELVNVDARANSGVIAAIRRANRRQSIFEYSLLDSAAFGADLLSYRDVETSKFFDDLDGLRKRSKGYHPFLIAVVASRLSGGTYSNLFGSHRARRGLAVISTHGVEGTIVPAGRMSSYFAYYIARYTLSFLDDGQKNHEDTRGCVLDRKRDRRDISLSMGRSKFCDECRRNIAVDGSISVAQFAAITEVFACSSMDETDEYMNKPRVFVGSSVEGLEIARELQSELAHDAHVEIWNEGGVFGLGVSTLESLEIAVQEYDFAIFVFTPDDHLHARGESRPVARDNVVFELGLFIGKLSRRKAFVVHPASGGVTLPSDLLGITAATYPADATNLRSALGPACQQIRRAMRA